jgi:hypothetical protein
LPAGRISSAGCKTRGFKLQDFNISTQMLLKKEKLKDKPQTGL